MKSRLPLRFALLAAMVIGCARPAGISPTASSPSPQDSQPAPLASAQGAEPSTPANDGLLDAGTSGDVAWAIADVGLEVSTDLGDTWTVISPATLDPKQILSVDLAAWPTGYVAAAGVDGTLMVMKTLDSGTTWTTQPVEATSPDGVGRVSLQVVGDKVEYLALTLPSSSASSVGSLLSSEDGGATWTQRDLPAGGEISFSTPLDGWLQGGPLDSQLFHTTDAGLSWEPVVVAAPQSPIDESVGLQLPIVAEGQLVMPARLFNNGGGPLMVEAFTSRDEGKNWKLQGPAERLADEGVSAPVAAASDLLVAVASGGFVVSTDAGASYKRVDARGPDPAKIASISILGDRTILALESTNGCTTFKADCSISNVLWRSEDGAVTWAALDVSPG